MKVRTLAVLAVFAFAQAAPMVNAQIVPATTSSASLVRAGAYNKAAETTVSGTITAFQRQTTGSALRGTYLVLQSGASKVNVHMGLFSAQNVPFKSGASVKVTGSLVTVNGAKVFLAREIQSGSESVAVRSANGLVLRPHTVNSDQVQGLQP